MDAKAAPGGETGTIASINTCRELYNIRLDIWPAVEIPGAVSLAL